MHHFNQEMIQDSIFCLSDFCFHLFTMLNKMFKSSDWHWIHISLRILGQNRSFIVVYKIGNMKISVYGNWYWILGVFYVWYHFIYIFSVFIFIFILFFSKCDKQSREEKWKSNQSLFAPFYGLWSVKLWFLFMLWFHIFVSCIS